MAEGDRADKVGIILCGTAQITRTDYSGNRNILTNIFSGELFAEVFACAGISDMPVDVTAYAETEVLFVRMEKLLDTSEQDDGFRSQIIFNLLKIVASKNLLLNQKIEITSKKTTRDKLMAYLELQEKKNQGQAFAIAYNRQELAD